jgi:glycosyltransferase involved in cell wall biosynthesis
VAGYLYKDLRFSAIAVNGDIGEHAKKAMRPDVEISVIPLGVRSARAETAGKPDGAVPSLILVGSLTPEKGVDNAIVAMALLRRRLGDSCPVLNVYGDAGSRGSEVARAEGFPLWNEYLEEMVGALGLSDLVVFHGNQPGILNRCDGSQVLLVASRGETGPMVVLEAMSRGMPVVSTRVGTVTEMLPDERYGRIVPVNSIKAFADAVQATLADIAAGRFDPGLLVARHRSCYSDVVMAERTNGVYAAAGR